VRFQRLTKFFFASTRGFTPGFHMPRLWRFSRHVRFQRLTNFFRFYQGFHPWLSHATPLAFFSPNQCMDSSD